MKKLPCNAAFGPKPILKTDHLPTAMIVPGPLSARTILKQPGQGEKLCRVSAQFLASQNVALPPGPDIGCYQDGEGIAP